MESAIGMYRERERKSNQCSYHYFLVDDRPLRNGILLRYDVPCLTSV